MQIDLLYIEDNPANIELLEDVCLLKPAVKLVSRTSVMDGMLEIKTKDFDIILLDIHLPDISGMDALPMIREIKPDTPVIALSASVMPQEIQRTLDLGFNAFITKPFDIAGFWKSLAAYLPDEKKSLLD